MVSVSQCTTYHKALYGLFLLAYASKSLSVGWGGVGWGRLGIHSSAQYSTGQLALLWVQPDWPGRWRWGMHGCPGVTYRWVLWNISALKKKGKEKKKETTPKKLKMNYFKNQMYWKIIKKNELLEIFFTAKKYIKFDPKAFQNEYHGECHTSLWKYGHSVTGKKNAHVQSSSNQTRTYSQVHKFWDIDTVLIFLSLNTTTMILRWNNQDVL